MTAIAVQERTNSKILFFLLLSGSIHRGIPENKRTYFSSIMRALLVWYDNGRRKVTRGNMAHFPNLIECSTPWRMP